MGWMGFSTPKRTPTDVKAELRVYNNTRFFERSKALAHPSSAHLFVMEFMPFTKVLIY
jgi:hypothetical protein